MLAWLAETAFGQLFKSLLGAIGHMIKQQQERADRIELGQLRQVTADQVAAIDAQKRMQAAAVKPHDVETTLGRLGDGTF